MLPRIKDVKALKDYELLLTFDNGEVKSFDVSPYLEKGNFRELKEPNVFYSVKPCLGSIQWSNGLDLCPDTLYMDSAPLNNE
ncbi:MAG: DUF2442 domain-containing protein [Bacteroidetes bacterium]|nr:DUF2442 domain-containing protein [Bacteroidota bacterium]